MKYKGISVLIRGNQSFHHRVDIFFGNKNGNKNLLRMPKTTVNTIFRRTYLA